MQAALYSILKLRLFIPVSSPGISGPIMGAGGSTSLVAMVACCAHHAVDVLPFLGLTIAATFLAKYQTIFMLISIGLNIIGIGVMLCILFREPKTILNQNLLTEALLEGS
ncbi:MAG: hypothetical protein Q7J07_02395 [Pelolinea sp.]|nr:hypothetical protein [Pelolinea sp.]